ncbi:MAG: endolytic transglycosylase MltG [Oscillospiraceae bacterium]|nr:endolytic transglycosylase MltG [Oscillospiraceae bacterium]
MADYDPSAKGGNNGERSPSEPGIQVDATRVFVNTGHKKRQPIGFGRRAKEFVEDVEYALTGDEKPAGRTVKKKTKRWGCFGGILYFLLVVCTAALMATVLWQAACDVLGLSDGDSEASVVILKTDDLEEITQKLKDAGMIKYKTLFKFYANYSKAMDKIQPGTYTLRTNYDYMALVSNMRTEIGRKDTVDVTIPEGYTVRQIFKILAENGVCLQEDLETIAADYDFGYDFLQGIAFGDYRRLEGYLFPDTYQFYQNDDPVTVIRKMLSNFDQRVTDEIRQLASSNGHSLRDVLIVASIIEKEAQVPQDRPLISSVIYNRLNSSFGYLQIDATVIYAMGEHTDSLSYEDLKYDDPYNTYMYEGLPPGPIANPGLDSIKAAADPADTDYMFYALKSDGSHYFSTTYEEHQAFLDSQQ